MAEVDLVSQVEHSGIIKDFEEIIFVTPVVHKTRGRGFLALTDCAIYFLVRPSRYSNGSVLKWATSRFSAGFIEDFMFGLRYVISASTEGILTKNLVIQFSNVLDVFNCANAQYYADLIVQAKKTSDQRHEQHKSEEKRKKEGRYCPKCGRKIPFDAYICSYCGLNFEDEENYPKEDNENKKTYIDENGYYRFKDTGILVHRWVMEKYTGHKLEPWEVVHHIDGNKLNNAPENLRIMTGPKSRDYHTKIHEKQIRETGDWHGLITCQECGAKYNKKVKFCSECGNKL